MGLSVSLILSAAGAILLWAVDAEVAGLDIQVVGVILLIVGIVGAILSLIYWSSWGGFGGDRGGDTHTTIVK
jgi:hypothetical protein